MTEWLDIPGYPEYQINEDRVVRRCHLMWHGKDIKRHKNGIYFCKGSKKTLDTRVRVHRTRTELWETSTGDGEWRDTEFEWFQINADLDIRKVKPLKVNPRGGTVNLYGQFRKPETLWQLATQGKEEQYDTTSTK